MACFLCVGWRWGKKGQAEHAAPGGGESGGTELKACPGRCGDGKTWVSM